MFLIFQVLPFLLLPLYCIFQILIHTLTLKHSKNIVKMHWALVWREKQNCQQAYLMLAH